MEQMTVGRGGVRPDAPFDHVYGGDHEEVAAQRAAFLDDLKREGFFDG
jgi:hypothetical protein